ncbi:MAG: OsmC family protein [Chthoniobacterales bacterium]
METDASAKSESKPPDVVVHGTAKDFSQKIVAGKHQLEADEPRDVGGTDAAPTPYDYLLAALGSCTSMTIGWYARKKNIPLEEIQVSLWQSRIHAKDCENCLTKEGMIDRIELEIALKGNLTQQQHGMLMDAAARCPVHRTLTSEIDITTRSSRPSSTSSSSS